MRINDGISDVCSSDLPATRYLALGGEPATPGSLPILAQSVADVVGDHRRSCPAGSKPISGGSDLESLSGVSEVNNVELLSGAEMVVRSLRDEGVKYIYGYPGGEIGRAHV